MPLERAKAQELHHLAERRKIIHGLLNLLGLRANTFYLLDLEQRKADGALK